MTEELWNFTEHIWQVYRIQLSGYGEKYKRILCFRLIGLRLLSLSSKDQNEMSEMLERCVTCNKKKISFVIT